MSRRPTIRSKEKVQWPSGDGGDDDDDDLQDALTTLVVCTRSYLAGAADVDLGTAGGLTISAAVLEPGRSFEDVGSAVDRLIDARAIALDRQTLRIEPWVVDMAREAGGGSSSTAGPRTRAAGVVAAGVVVRHARSSAAAAARQSGVLWPAAHQPGARVRRWAALCAQGGLIALGTLGGLAFAVTNFANAVAFTAAAAAQSVASCYGAVGWLSHLRGVLVGAAPTTAPVPRMQTAPTLPRVRFAAPPVERPPAALPQEPPKPLVPTPSPAPTDAAEAAASPVAATAPVSATVPSSTEPSHRSVAPEAASSASGVGGGGRDDSTDASSAEELRHSACPPGEVTLDDARASIKARLASHYWLRPTRSLRQCEGCDGAGVCVNETNVRACMGV